MGGLLGAQGGKIFLTFVERTTHLPLSLIFPHLQRPEAVDVAVAVVELGLWVVGSVAFHRRLGAGARPSMS